MAAIDSTIRPLSGMFVIDLSYGSGPATAIQDI
jgi:hypothetical protein